MPLHYFLVPTKVVCRPYDTTEQLSTAKTRQKDGKRTAKDKNYIKRKEQLKRYIRYFDISQSL